MSLVKLFAFIVVKKLSSMLDSLSSRREGPGGKAGACSKGVSIGERKESMTVRLEFPQAEYQIQTYSQMGRGAGKSGQYVLWDRMPPLFTDVTRVVGRGRKEQQWLLRYSRAAGIQTAGSCLD